MSIDNIFCADTENPNTAARGKKIYMGGINGVGMYPLALLLKSKGFDICGYDEAGGERTKALMNNKITARKKFKARDMKGADAFVYSNALCDASAPFLYAKKHGIVQFSRAEALGQISKLYTTTVGVAGMHGKSTTTAAISKILTDCKKNPTVLVGARAAGLDYIRQGGSDYLVYEACEYMRSFLSMPPRIALALNMELEHTDCYKTLSHVKEAFLSYLNSDTVGICLINADDENLVSLLPKIRPRTYTFSTGSHCGDFCARDITLNKNGIAFDFSIQGHSVGRVESPLFGMHNVSNLTAALAVSAIIGVDMKAAVASASSFSGTHGRCEYRFSVGNTRVFEDYAHHPTEIAASISALRAHGIDRIACIFQPHTYSRVASFSGEMARALALADGVIVTDIYPAREKNVYNASGDDIAGKIGEKAEFIPDMRAAALRLREKITEYDGAVLMGAGDIFSVTGLLRANCT